MDLRCLKPKSAWGPINVNGTRYEVDQHGIVRDVADADAAKLLQGSYEALKAPKKAEKPKAKAKPKEAEKAAEKPAEEPLALPEEPKAEESKPERTKRKKFKLQKDD